MFLAAYLSERGIQTVIHYPVPPHQQEAYSEWAGALFPTSEELHASVLSLPISPVMEAADVDAVIAAVNEYRPRTVTDSQSTPPASRKRN